ncbi:CPBP family intramembrane glutamic endopeptidase [Staphylococcus sp. 17KM0847]|uniref:CPBP family intramembrane glutamic endopeptidase n=1 Tax=Staphylococcus sp. 17KM0847 TaxID=2583989 RepID=UPI0015DC3990|nr:type II CAAX endopeptidase family protein [Staphylococcus sp. 17KM0847]QLK85476.1 CPBP family intramembrane metalloprotease [Staphylococcus sp. 17KM0847]
MNHSQPKTAWRDLWAFFIYFTGQAVIIPILTLLAIGTNDVLPVPIAIIIGSLLVSLGVISFLIWSHRHNVRTYLVQCFSNLRHYIKLIIFTYICYIIANAVFMLTISHLPKKWQFEETGNQEALKMFFENPQWLPLVFISIVIVTPITEELLFRYVIVGELGKKFGIGIMGIISIATFASLHMQASQTILEIIPYILMGAMFVMTYIKSNCNIVVSITTHMFNNFIAFVAITMQTL